MRKETVSYSSLIIKNWSEMIKIDLAPLSLMDLSTNNV